MQNQVDDYSDTSPRASPVARDLFPLLHRCAGSDPAASDPRIALHPGLARSAPREASAAPQNAIFKTESEGQAAGITITGEDQSVCESHM